MYTHVTERPAAIAGRSVFELMQEPDTLLYTISL